MGELFTDSAPPILVETGTGLLIDGRPVPSGVRVRVPADIADFLVAQKWARKTEKGHATPRGVLEWQPVRQIPGVGVGLDEWPTYMRPSWMRAEARVKPNGRIPQAVPTYCTKCERVDYQPEHKGAERTARGVQRIVCKRCV